jgi:hypothetical protein
MLRPILRQSIDPELNRDEAARILQGHLEGSPQIGAILYLLAAEYDDASAVACDPSPVDRAHATGQMYALARLGDILADAFTAKPQTPADPAP